jgi:predicted HTH transcriptional regulator
MHRSSDIKCSHSHGTSYQRPFLSYQIYEGDLFALADQAREFVLSRINRSVGTRQGSVTAPAAYELPEAAVAEAIINAVAHRDYNSNASIEVRLFADRLEVWNPGALPGTLTPASLREDHASVPNNPLIADPLYLARYIEKAGTGTQTMIALCGEAGLPEPDFEERHGSVVVTLWRDWLTDDAVGRLELNDRQTRAITWLKAHRRISNAEYQDITGAIKKTATRDLHDLKEKGVLEQRGTRGPGVHYVLAKGDKKETNGT